MANLEKKPRKLDTSLMILVAVVMVIIILFVLVDIVFMNRTLKLYRALVLLEKIPWQVEKVAMYQERYNEDHRPFILGEFATELTSLGVSFTTLVENSWDDHIAELGREAETLIDNYQDNILEKTDRLLEHSKVVERSRREIERGRIRISKAIDRFKIQTGKGVSKAALADGLFALHSMQRTAENDRKFLYEERWRALLEAYEQYAAWADKQNNDDIATLGSDVSRNAGTILEQRQLILDETSQINKITLEIQKIHRQFLRKIQIVAESSRNVLEKKLNRNLTMMTINLLVSLGMIVIMLVLIAAMIRTRISMPISKMIRTMDRIRRGNMEDRVPIPDSEELSRLAKTFNEMADSVYESRRDLMVQRDRLERIVEKRTGELSSVNQALLKSNQELDDFTYTVSHDLKEPLRGISSFAQFLTEEYYDSIGKDGQEYIDIINRSAGRMKKLIDDLLELSRITRRRNPREAFLISEAFEEIEQEFALLLQEKNGELRYPKEEISIVCDGVRVKQVFANLIHNGLKFNRSEKPAVEVRVEEGIPKEAASLVSVRGAFFTFSIKDNGIGIDPKHFKQIFDIFQRLVSREEFEGTGAGLAICKRIVEDHGGAIWIDSEPGKGTTFFVALPKVAPQVENVSIGPVNN